MEKTMLEIGKVVNTHGIRGELKIQPWCDEAEQFLDFSYCYINGERYDIQKVRLHKNCVIVQTEQITNMNDAEALKNSIVTMERDALGELPEGTYYIADLEGLKVQTTDGTYLGVIDEIIKTGSNDVYVLKETFNKKQILIPVIEDVVKEVCIDGGYVTVELIKGLVD